MAEEKPGNGSNDGEEDELEAPKTDADEAAEPEDDEPPAWEWGDADKAKKEGRDRFFSPEQEEALSEAETMLGTGMTFGDIQKMFQRGKTFKPEGLASDDQPEGERSEGEPEEEPNEEPEK